jgi:hypothetical protein
VGQEALEGMPEPVGLRLSAGAGQCLVSCGRMLLYRYDADDVGMRNLAIVALTDAGRRVERRTGSGFEHTPPLDEFDLDEIRDDVEQLQT